MPKHRTLNHDFFKQWSHKMAYVLGYIAADAAITIGKRGNCYLDIQSIDQELPKTIRRLLEANHAISIRKRKAPWSTIYRLQIGSKEIIKDLGLHGMAPHKAKRLVMPQVPHRYFGDFLRGYFDGDGNVSWAIVQRKDRPGIARHLQTLFTSGTAEFLGMIHHRLREEFGLGGGSLHFSSRAYRLLYAGHDSIKIYRLMYSKPKRSSLKRKREYFRKAVKKFLARTNN